MLKNPITNVSENEKCLLFKCIKYASKWMSMKYNSMAPVEVVINKSTLNYFILRVGRQFLFQNSHRC